MTELDDTDPMPFGAHNGKPLSDVPTSYFYWLWINGKKYDYQCPVADYIRRNLDALQMELQDVSWG